MTDKQIIEQVSHAFKEFMLVHGVFGIKPGREGVKILWEKYFLPKLEWRLDHLYKRSKIKE